MDTEHLCRACVKLCRIQWKCHYFPVILPKAMPSDHLRLQSDAGSEWSLPAPLCSDQPTTFRSRGCKKHPHQAGWPGALVSFFCHRAGGAPTSFRALSIKLGAAAGTWLGKRKTGRLETSANVDYGLSTGIYTTWKPQHKPELTGLPRSLLAPQVLSTNTYNTESTFLTLLQLLSAFR